MKNSSIPHPEREPLIIIRQWQLEFTGGACASALLSFFEYWHNAKLDMQERKPGASLLQHHTAKELHAGIMGLYNRDKIRDALAKLERLGVLEIQKNPKKQYGYDRTRHFLFKPEPIKLWLKSRTTAENRTSTDGKSHLPSAENRTAIPETTAETSYPKTTRNEEMNGGKPPVCGFEIPSPDEVNRYWSEKYGSSANGKRDHYKSAAESWWAICRSRHWRMPSGAKIRYWKKAMDSYIQHYKPPVHDDDTKWKELEDHADEIEMDRNAFRQFMAYRNRDNWAARNAVTGKMEPIRDRKANMEAFWEAIQECRRWQYQ
jgi:hypothetical protein